MSLQTELRQVVVDLNGRLASIPVGVPVSVPTRLDVLDAAVKDVRSLASRIELLAMKIQNGEVVSRG